jgi:hypothetical protein
VPNSRSTNQSAGTRNCGAGPDLQSFDMEIAFDLDVRHDDSQHLLVHVNPRDVVWLRPPPSWERRAASTHSSGREPSPGTPRRELEVPEVAVISSCCPFGHVLER